MKTLSANLRALTKKLHGTSPWLFLYEIEADVTTTARTLFRLVPYPEQVTFAGTTYHPFPITHDVTELVADGSLPTVQLTLSNASRELPRYLEIGRGMLGNSVTITLINRQHLASASDGLVMRYRVIGASMSDESLVFRLDVPSPHRQSIPTDVAMRDRCGWQYGSTECGFVLTATTPAQFLVCPKTVAACTERGNHEVNQGRGRLHPRRFGGFPALPRGVLK
jgi:phage-related protein